MKKTLLFTPVLLLFHLGSLHAQCAADETSVSIVVKTDNYGYETYWSLVPGSNDCATAPIASGGNAQQVGCNGGGQEDATTAYGYNNNDVVTEGPWCLKTDSTYTLHHVDDYGDGGPEFTVMIAGFPVYTFKGVGEGNAFEFTVTMPLEFDASLQDITTYGFNELGAIPVRGVIFNMGSTPITSIDVNYTVDGGATITETLTGLDIAPFTEYDFTLDNPWTPAAIGNHQLDLTLSNINGNLDLEPGNNALSKTVYIRAVTPNLIASYLTDSLFVTNIGTALDGLDGPRDLDFAPKELPELWVVNKETENEGGSTVTYFNAGLPDQDPQYKKDQNAWHFMSLPTGIAFSYNGNFATSPGVLDANHQGTSAHFTGPALWSGDWSVYAEPSGANGSHLDMVHQSPFSMGIEWEADNVFWVYDGYNKNIVRYDFKKDHGPGNDYHADAIVRRYTEVQVQRLDNHIANHLVLDRASGWLYIVDNGNHRVLRMDTRSGEVAANLTPYAEPLEEYVRMTDVTWSVYIDSLDKPSGIDFIGDYLLVSDYTTGDILVYDRSGDEGVELGRLETGASGIMGIEIGPDGKIWYVNATQDEINRLDFTPHTVSAGEPQELPSVEVSPNPSTGSFNLRIAHTGTPGTTFQVSVLNSLGQKVLTLENVTGKNTPIQLPDPQAGLYYLQVTDGKTIHSEPVVIIR
jgi:hypothetical protein